MSTKFPVVIGDGESIITFHSEDNGVFLDGTKCMSSLSDMMVRVESGKARILPSRYPTIAEQVAGQHKRVEGATANGAFEAITNQYIHVIHSVRMYHKEIIFKDGSVLWVLDSYEARIMGMTEFDYAIKTQEKAV